MSYVWTMFAGLLIGAAIGVVCLLTVYRTSEGAHTPKKTGRDDLRKAA